MRQRPVAEEWEWQLHAACRGSDPELFFRRPGERGPALRERETQAQAICSACPVRRTCLEWALAVPELYGVWGGRTEEELRRERGTAASPGA
jgi:WhiB family redox-sensing transcriptional regulator